MDDDLAKVISFHSGVAAVGSKYGRARRNLVSANSITAMEIATALEEFMESVRYLNTRRTGGAILRLQSEADVQDAIYLMLRPWVTDLVPEDPSGRVGNRYTIKDFLSPSAKTVIEAKFIRDRDHGRHISSELHDDIESYRHNPVCEHVLFFVYDPDTHIPDAAALKRSIHVERLYDGRKLNVRLITKP